MLIRFLRRSDIYYRIGLFFLVVSLVLYFLPVCGLVSKEAEAALFFFHAIIALIYWAIRTADRQSIRAWWRVWHQSIQLNLLLLGALALNRDLQVYYSFVPWFLVLLLVSGLQVLLLPGFNYYPRAFRYCLAGLNGVSILIHVYLMMLALPYYPLGVLGLLAVGIGLYLFVPVLFLFFLIRQQIRIRKKSRRYGRLSWSAIFVTLLVAGFFVVQSVADIQYINQRSDRAAANGSDLPAWWRLSQEFGKDTRYGRLLWKASRSGPETERVGGSFDFFSLLDFVGETDYLHDPLVKIALVCAPPLRVDPEYLRRVASTTEELEWSEEERLWSAAGLVTKTVDTRVSIWPTCQLAYTEFTIETAQTDTNRVSGQAKEAIYLFQLPEGAVVSSLSLWVNGREERARVTSPGKAREAYRAIVGREQRDPSMVLWKEGNGVSVRVFPVPMGGERKFRLGISSFLKRDGNRLIYREPIFQGPPSSNAVANTLIEFQEAVADLQLPGDFEVGDNGIHWRKGRYSSGWSTHFAAPVPAACSYRFQGESYYLDQFRPNPEPAPIAAIYLDLHKYWKREEALAILKAADDRPVFTLFDKPTLLTINNFDQAWSRAQDLEFGLIPFYQIPDWEQALLVYKPGKNRIKLGELENYRWYTALEDRPNAERIRFFNIGEEPEVLISTLRDMRLLHYASGDIPTLTEWISKRYFPRWEENDRQVVLFGPSLILRKTPEPLPVSGPDHLVRLFVYNDILKKSGGRFAQSPVNEKKFAEMARTAQIVSPFSSMIVLETEQDYQRFQIEENPPGSLSTTAGIQNGGAAPEPEEWALIAVGICFFLGQFFYQRRFKFRNS